MMQFIHVHVHAQTLTMRIHQIFITKHQNIIFDFAVGDSIESYSNR